MKEIELQEIETEEEKKEHPILKKIIITFIIIILSLTIYINLIGTKFIEVKEYKLQTTLLPISFNGLKIVHFSDIHYGTTINSNELKNMVDKINQLKPDIIFFTGDLIDKNIKIDAKTKQEIIDILSKLECKEYKYAIYGDEDYSNDNYKEIIEASDFKLLDNESTLLYYKNNTPIQITGYNAIDTSPDYSIINNPINEIETNNLYKIVLVHEPDAYINIKDYNPNLILSGNTLGNLINIPGIKNLFMNKNATKYYEEYYNENNTYIYISTGLGTSNYKIRFNNRPSFNLYRIYTQ